MASLYGDWGRGEFLVERLVMFKPYAEEDPWDVQTISGRPAAPLDNPCGHRDGFPPQAAAFDRPAGVALYARAAGARDNETLYVADAGNHVVRAVTAVCSQPCENGGRCVAPETCACLDGWTGADCAAPVCGVGAKLLEFGANSTRDTLPTAAPSAVPTPAPYAGFIPPTPRPTPTPTPAPTPRPTYSPKPTPAPTTVAPTYATAPPLNSSGRRR